MNRIIALLLFAITTSSVSAQDLRNVVRQRPIGPATVDCVNLHDSRCANRLAGQLPPACSVSFNPGSPVTLGPGNSPVDVTVTANCSPAATQWQWTATSGVAPTTQARTINYVSAGTYCYQVAGRNQTLYRDFGAQSSQACLTVQGGSGCAPQSPYTETLGCPSGQTGSISRYYSYDTMSCTWSYSETNSCAAACSPQAPYSQTLSCPPGQSGSVTRNFTYSTATCSWSHSDNINCFATPTCGPGQEPVGATCQDVAPSALGDWSSCMMGDFAQVTDMGGGVYSLTSPAGTLEGGRNEHRYRWTGASWAYVSYTYGGGGGTACPVANSSGTLSTHFFTECAQRGVCRFF